MGVEIEMEGVMDKDMEAVMGSCRPRTKLAATGLRATTGDVVQGNSASTRRGNASARDYSAVQGGTEVLHGDAEL